MRIKELLLKDYQNIREANFTDLSDLVVIAGPNGVGKTKIKDAICYIFQNNGNPPNDQSKVILEATNEKESLDWGAETVTLPNNVFWAFFWKPKKKLKTNARLLNIEANRQIDSIQFKQITLESIGDPDSEEIDANYSSQSIRDRFKDICNTLHREKMKLIADMGQNAYKSSVENPNSTKVEVDVITDPTVEFEKIFAKLLYPKKMKPIDVNSRTIEYIDDNGDVRNFQTLSSGEREVIVLTFDILLQHPSDSIILIDEPEIHLHPELTFRLLKVLKSIGERNQFFLFTHSSDIIGSSFDTGIHFIRPKNRSTGNQVVKINSENIVELKQIPNLRETVGMLSLGKKLLFVEGTQTSIDRDVFSSIAKTSKIDLAIIPSESCHNINNMASISDTLSKGLFGLDLFMVRDRDSLTDEEINNFIGKSKSHLFILPFYHIENLFLDTNVLAYISTKFGGNKKVDDIENKLKEIAKEQIHKCINLYVTNEIRFKSGNLDVSVSNESDIEKLKLMMKNKRSDVIQKLKSSFDDSFIDSRIEYWDKRLSESLNAPWNESARNLFYGKSILPVISQFILPNKKNLIVWQEILKDDNDICKSSYNSISEILSKL